jgi:hypothetical protein
MSRTLMALLLFFVVSLPSYSQTSNAALGGTVSDSGGALIPGVTVTATNAATGIAATTLTNEAGAYNFPTLQTGTYRISAELPGFQTQTFNEVALGISQQVRLNFALQVASVAQTVEVTVEADTLIASTSASVGSVLTEQRVRDLPLAARDIMGLLQATAGAGPMVATARVGEAKQGYFAGGRLSAVNTMRDGFVVSDGRYDHGAFSATYISPDLVEEVRIITAPVDAEAGRGAGQVQMVTRSGSNEFRGSVFWTNRNSLLDANNWFNNFNNVTKDYENRNQFGGRIGGPIIKNKTFFFFLLEEQRYLKKETFVGSVLTAQARQGIFRFFPNSDNQNATSNNPVVDRSGNPVRPRSATDDLQQISVFNRDSFRPGFDPSGFIQNTLLARMPMPNDFTVGDGLNTAGIRFTRRIYGLDQPDGNANDTTNRDQINFRIDHQLNANHKLSGIYTWERNLDVTDQAGIMQWPGGFNGANNRWPRVLNGSLISTLTPSVVNELRIGYMRTKQFSWFPGYVGRNNESEETGEAGREAYKLLPQLNGMPYTPLTTLFQQNVMNWTSGAGSTRWTDSPRYTFADSIGWNMGAHSFKAGGEWRYGTTSSGNDNNFTPAVTLGAGGVVVQNIDNVAIPGLSANNQTLARNLLTDLSGSVNQIQQAFDIRDPKSPVFLGYKDGVKLRIRDWHAKEFSGFFKDSWKATPDVTLNLGVHYEWFGVPYEKIGRAGRVVGGAAGLCGISCGSLTTVQFVGKNSPNPNEQLFNNDWNNLAPSFGISWSLPWLGQNKTVLRAGYGWSITGGPLKGASGGINGIAGSVPGMFGGNSSGAGSGLTYNQPGYLSLANLSLPIPLPFAPLQPVPIDGTRSETLQAYDRRDPYIQNFNAELQRELVRNFTMSVSYVGTKGTALWGGIPLNVVNINASVPGSETFLEAFNITRAGGNAQLFNRMLTGLNIPGAGVVNGTTVTGSAALRAYTATRSFVANGNIGQLADFLNRSTNITGRGGGFVRNGGLPENFFVLNPQFQNVYQHSNPGSSTYHSMQVQVTKRLSHGFTSQASYNWSRALGESDGDGVIDYIDPSNRASHKQLLGFHRTHFFSTNGTYQIPFGPGRAFLNDSPAWVQRIVEGWQLSGIFTRTSGPPLSIYAPVSTIWQHTNPNQSTSAMTPDIVAEFPKDFGKVTKVSNGILYFEGLQQVNDPASGNVSSLNALSGAFNLKAIADSQGRILLMNPQPGKAGTLGQKWIQGPPSLNLDLNIVKRIRLSENKQFEFRIDAINVLNYANFAPPNLNINSTGTGTATGVNGTNVAFGRITQAGAARRFVINARLNF